MKAQGMYDLGFGYCKGDKYQKPVIKNGKYYCPVCGDRMKMHPRTTGLCGILDSRPIVELD